MKTSRIYFLTVVIALVITFTSVSQTNTNLGVNSGTLGAQSTNIGSNAGRLNIGVGNSFIGFKAGDANTTGSSNTFIGSNSGFFNITGSSNVCIGVASGFSKISGDSNVFIGNYSGENNVSGFTNVFLGSESGYGNNGFGNVFLGYRTGHSETGNNKLYIDNSSTSTPLLYGNFSTNELTINGSLAIKDGSQQDGYVLTSDAAGKGSWLPAAGDDGDWTVSGTNMHSGVTGNVGIGTSSPAHKLDVSGNLRVTGSTYLGNGTIANGTNSFASGYLNTASGAYSTALGTNSKATGSRAFSAGYWSTASGNYSVALGTRVYATNDVAIALGIDVRANANRSIIIGAGIGNSSSLQIHNNITRSLMVGFNSNIPTFFVGSSSGLNTTGNVGIATTAPQSKLHVNGTFSLTDGTQQAGYVLTSNANGQASWQAPSGGGNDEDWTISGNNMYSTLSGNVGIGTTDFPETVGTVNINDYRLFVKGGILTEAVRVRVHPWADYVFDHDYDLKSLKDIEEHIAQKGHLPNVPSAKTVSEQGLELGDITRIQQEKIEELYLYAIQQEKKSTEQEEKIAAQEKENKELKKKFIQLEEKLNQLLNDK